MLSIQQQLEPQMPTVVWCPNVFRLQIASERISSVLIEAAFTASVGIWSYRHAIRMFEYFYIL